MLLSERVQPQFHYHDFVVVLVTFLQSQFWTSTAVLAQTTGFYRQQLHDLEISVPLTVVKHEHLD